MKRFLTILVILCAVLALAACGKKPTDGNDTATTPTATPAETAKPTEVLTPTAEPTSEATPTAEPTAEATPTAEPTAEATPTAEPTAEATPTEAVVPTKAPMPTRIPTPSIPAEIPDGCVLEWLPVQTMYYTTGGQLGRELTFCDYDENGNMLWEVWLKEIDDTPSDVDKQIWKEIARKETSYENGRIVKELLGDETGTVKTITYVYDANGTETRTFSKADGSVEHTDMFEFNKDGKLLRKTRTKDGVSTVLYEAEFDASGRVIKDVTCATDDSGVYYLTSEFRYTENGSVRTTVKSNDREGKQIASVEEINCDAKGNETRKEYKEFGADNAVTYHSVDEYEYTDDRVVKWTQTVDSTDLGINKTYVTEYKYEFDADGRKTGFAVWEDGVNTWERTWEYSSDGRTVQYAERHFNVDGSLHAEEKDVFNYDENGNLIKSVGAGEEYSEYDAIYTPRVITEELHKQLGEEKSDLLKNDEDWD